MRTYRQTFESIDEVMNYLAKPRDPNAGTDSESNPATDSWTLGLDYEGTMDCYTGGWAEGASKAYELADRLAPKPRGGRRRALERSVVGGIVNTGAVMAGAPKAMYRVAYANVTARPYVHLYLPIGYSSGTNATVAFDRGCALVAIIDALVNVGCRVKITLTRTSEIRADLRICQSFMVKDYQDVLDIDQIIFTAAHPAMFRRICFALEERASDNQHVIAKTRGSYGTSMDMQEDDTEDDSNVIRVIFPRLTGGYGTPELFLKQMVGALPETLQTEIESVGKK